MSIDTSIPNSPGWWFNRLLKRLSDERPRLDALNDYYEGDAAVPVLSTKAIREAYSRLMSMARTNFAELVVEAVRERINPTGFRTGAQGDDLGDSEAWRIWQANQLDADSQLVHRWALSMSRSYVMVGGVDPETLAPRITPEDPRYVITEQHPVLRRKAIAALKIFCDDIEGVYRAFVFLPGYVMQAVKVDYANELGGEVTPTTYEAESWDWAGDPQPLPSVTIPVVKFEARTDGLAEFEPHVPILDRINYTVLSRVEVATMQAFRQRGIKGLPQKDSNGNDINYDDIFSADPGALWQLPETAEVWESGQVDLGPIRDSIRHDVQDLAAVTRTPLFYLTPDAANGSAEGASLAREGLVFKTTDRLVTMGESWEEVMSIAFMFAGDAVRANRNDMEVIWASPERFSLAERYDAAVKAQAAGVPWRSVMRSVLGFSPQEVERMAAERAAEQLAAAALTAALQPQPPQLNQPVNAAV